MDRILSGFLVFAISIFSLELGAQGLKTTRTKRFTKPLYFDILGANRAQIQPVFEYDLTLNQGRTLKLGAISIDEKTFSFSYRRLKDVDPAAEDSTGAVYFMANWPDFLFPEAKIEMFSREGKVIWSKEITSADLDQWKQKRGKPSKGKKKSALQNIEWGLEASLANLPFRNLADGFRFCLSRLRVGAQERLCSQRYVIRKVGNQFLLGRIKTEGSARALVNGENAELKGDVFVEGPLPLRFFAELVTGETLEFSSRPLKVVWSDFVKVEKTPLVRVVGYETPPVGHYQVVNQAKTPTWVEALGFEATIYDPRKFWAVAVKEQEPWLYFPGESGGVFKHLLPVEKAPSSRLRLHLHKDTPPGTYRDGVVIRGRKQPTTVVESNEREIESEKNSPEFEWSFKADQNAEINRSSLLLQDGDQTYSAYYEMYKGYANEFSGRLSMILSDAGLIFLGEGAYNHWFEDVMGWNDYHLTKQRWGLSTKYFQSITKYKVEGAGDATLQVLNADLKYRFTPGIWTRDESHGAMISYQSTEIDVTTTKFEVPMIGVGWFWARSMPRVFDELFNQLPFMNYPKWVDMEFIFYGMSMDSSKVLNTNFALNFHGQVLWKKNFFGEAGFGIKRYAFIDKTNPAQANLGYQLNTLYGTVGIGYKF